MGVVVGYHFRNRSHKGYRLVDGVDYSHRGDCTEQRSRCQVLFVTQTGASSRSFGGGISIPGISTPPELNLGYVLNSGAHDPRDGTFATVVEDGWAGKAQSPPCRGRTVGFGLGNGLVSVTVVEKVVQRVRLGGRSPCGCEFLRLLLQR